MVAAGIQKKTEKSTLWLIVIITYFVFYLIEPQIL